MRRSPLSSVLLATLLAASVSLANDPLPTSYSDHFAGAGACGACHTGSGTIMFEDGVDISPTTEWRSTMMASAGKDPLWRAAVSAEVSVYPQLQSVIEDKCTRCHAPMGSAEAEFAGALPYSMADMMADELALDGVSCTLCHQIAGGNLGQDESFSGGFEVNPDHDIYGPYGNPLIGPMVNNTGFLPVGADHLSEAALCATCHNLFTPFVDDDGNVAGEFPEQLAYTEWVASDFVAAGMTCQECHTPRSPNPVDISTEPPWHAVEREPYWKHELVGGNGFMLGMLRDNAEAIGVTAEAEHLDATIQLTLGYLREQTVDLTATVEVTGDLTTVAVNLRNLTGHKLPTGIPLRRVWVHLAAFDETGALVFESGAWNDAGRIVGVDEPFEPHHELITEPDQVQIYEGIMGDVNGTATYTLLRAAGFLKDNRLPPAGATSADPEWPLIAVVGAAAADADFNRADGQEGTGADVIRYRIPAAASVEIEVCYQSVNPAFVDRLAEFATPEVAAFLEYYADSDNEPIVIASETLELGVTGVDVPTPIIRLNPANPNPFNPGTELSFLLARDEHVRLTIHDLRGREFAVLVDGTRTAGEHRITWRPRGLPSGTYLARLAAGAEVQTQKLVLVR